ncbi:pyridoxamine 5'-phosphate oxidase family protein [Kaustia mangrovi]|uniref:Pyridoxamine 5'-phosphate oxidase family protein n=1 Tax=Kaustia mangrovi TaxID=2593653 RepID=A0A7S8C7F8_9HYPH|nr:pyridoxamine 5'-phosphate oxidase family protein [Kaustia mangrovi]QPC44786.1 pyridoxamine 5'-phosphate oxidase family protein [Kaustia mangrovi]
MTDTATAERAHAPTDRTRLRRAHERGHYDRATIDAILDAMPLCHIGFSVDGKPAVLPTIQWREGDRVYWHGSSASRMLRAAAGAPVCLTVTIFDGLVLARSAFHHSANYRSVVVYGTAEPVAPEDKARHLDRFMEGLLPGRIAQMRAMTDQEIKATTVLSMPLDEASAKIRTGPPVDDEEDYGDPVWAGVLPFRTQTLAPIPCPRLLDGLEVPDAVRDFKMG